MPVPISRYRVSGRYLWAGLVALGLAGLSGWMSVYWPVCWVATALFVVSAGLVLYVASRPVIEIYDDHLKIGSTAIPWRQIRRLDRSANLPLIVRLTLSDKKKILIVYPGGSSPSSGLLRQLRKHSLEALIDGVPYRQFWGGSAAAVALARKLLANTARIPLLLPDDEAEVERMFQRLKTVGNLDSKASPEDK